MESKFNFYDFVGYIIPGAIFVLILYWFLYGFFGFTIQFDTIELFSTVVFLSISYFVGHLLQGIGSYFTNGKKGNKEGLFRTKKYSCDFLKDDNDFYSLEQKKEIKKKIKEVFNIDLESENVDEKRIKEAFYLCYSLIVQEKIAAHTEIFNGFYSFFRGLKLTTFFGAIVNLLILLEQVILCKCKIASVLPIKYQINLLIISFVLLVFFVISYLVSRYRCDDFSKHFANSVYRSFLVYCDKNSKP